NVIEFEPPSRRTTNARFAHERAPVAIALANRALHVHRDVTRVGCAAPSRQRPIGRRELLFLEPDDQDVECALQHRRHIAGWDSMAQQGLSAAKLVVEALGDGHLECETLWRRLPDLGR